MIPGGLNCQRELSNIQHDPGPVEGALEKRMIITGGWNSQRKASITQHDTSLIEEAMNEMIPSEWNRQAEASNTQQESGPVVGTLVEEMTPGG